MFNQIIQIKSIKSKNLDIKSDENLAQTRDPVDTGRKLNVHKKFGRRLGRLLNVLCTFNLRPVSARDTGHMNDIVTNLN